MRASDRIILFDGVCNLCEASVRFVHRRDRRGRFRFAAAQSPAGRLLQEGIGIEALAAGTVVLLEGRRVYTESEAALRIARELDRPWNVLALLRVLPRGLRDPVYRWVARNRYRWFGRKAACGLADPALAAREVPVEELPAWASAGKRGETPAAR